MLHREGGDIEKSTPHREDASPTSPVCWTRTLIRSLVCATIIFGLDLVSVYASYARPFLYTANSQLQIVVQAAVFSLLVTVVLTVVVQLGHRLSRLLSRFRLTADVRLSTRGFGLFQLLLGCLIIFRSDAALFGMEAFTAFAVVAVCSGVVFWSGDLFREHTFDEAVGNLLLFVALLLSAWFLRRHFATFVDGSFGFGSSEQLLRTTMIFGVPLGAFCVFGLRALNFEERLEEGGRLIVYSGGLLVTVGVFQYLSLTYYVDNYLLIHLILSVGSYVLGSVWECQ